MDDTIRHAIDRLKADSRSGASELLPQALALLRAAVQVGPCPEDVARGVAEAQPCMAPMWNAALAALAAARRPGALDAFERRSRRAPAAMARVAAESLAPVGRSGLHVITCSFSGSVLACLRRLQASGQVSLVSCAEGRPACEGRRTAEALASEGIPVAFYSDAALALALEGGGGQERIVLVGADAVAPGWAINKVGTAMLATAAARAGVPVYVAATRDKFMDARVATLLEIVEHDPAEVWDGPPAGVTVRNSYFERLPIDLVAGIVSDAGLLTAGMIAEACRAASAGASDADVGALARRETS
jgi:translation initiation factor 2B subunit (eIF-2B alpha/beta/delta family)